MAAKKTHISSRAQAIWITKAINDLLKEGRADVPKELYNEIAETIYFELGGMNLKVVSGRTKSMYTIVKDEITPRTISRQKSNMAYNITHQTVERYENALKRVYEEVWIGNKILKLRTKDNNATAYKLREAMAAAERLGVEPWNEMQIKVSIEGDTLILERRDRKVELPFEVVERVDTVDDPINQFGVVSYVMQHEPEAVIFTKFEGDLEVLRNWCENKAYEIEDTDPLTLKKVSEDVQPEEA